MLLILCTCLGSFLVLEDSWISGTDLGRHQIRCIETNRHGRKRILLISSGIWNLHGICSQVSALWMLWTRGKWGFYRWWWCQQGAVPSPQFLPSFNSSWLGPILGRRGFSVWATVQGGCCCGIPRSFCPGCTEPFAIALPPSVTSALRPLSKSAFCCGEVGARSAFSLSSVLCWSEGTFCSYMAQLWWRAWGWGREDAPCCAIIVALDWYHRHHGSRE